MTPAGKNIGIGAIVAALSGGGGVMAFDAMLDLGDQRWVTVAAQNLQVQWTLEDEIAEIEGKITSGTATQWDRERLAVLKDRLKRLEGLK